MLKPETEALRKLLDEVGHVSREGARGLGLLPPVSPADKVWQSPSDVMGAAFDTQDQKDEPYDLLAALEALPGVRDNQPAFDKAVQRFHDLVVERPAPAVNTEPCRPRWPSTVASILFIAAAALCVALVAISWRRRGASGLIVQRRLPCSSPLYT